MDQIRITFLAFLSVAVIGAGVSAFAGKRPQPAAPAQTASFSPEKTISTPRIATSIANAPSAAAAVAPTKAPAPTVAIVRASQTPARALPAIFAESGETDPASAKLPTFICGTANTGAHLTLLHMQAHRLDLAHGFRLGIVPFGLMTAYDASAAERAEMLRAGTLDCDFVTPSTLNAQGPGVATALVGAQSPIQIWTRNLGALGSGDHTRLAYEAGGASEWRIHVALSQLGVPESTMTLLPMATLRGALVAFNNGQADAVAGWQPSILEAETGGGAPLFDNNDSAAVDAVLLVARTTIASKSDVVKRFHLAWFDALSQERLDLESAAQAVAEWGHNDWTGISMRDSVDDWRALNDTASSISLARNAELLRQPAAVLQRINAIRRKARAEDVLADLAIDPSFVQNALDLTAAQPDANLAATDTSVDTLPQPISSDPAVMSHALADCERIEFVPGTLEIETASRLQIDACVLPALAKTPNAILRVRGSSAWPGPKGAHTRAEVEGAARQRANAVIDYLVTLGVERKRLLMATLLPPPSHRESEDIAIQAADRYVDLALILPGF